QIAINGHIKFNLTIPLQQLNGLETLVIIMVANKYAFLQITRRRFLNEWEAFKKVISRRNIRRRITIPLTLDRKSGSAGMPRPISYAVFCLKKKNHLDFLQQFPEVEEGGEVDQLAGVQKQRALGAECGEDDHEGAADCSHGG